jgi:hypothetical protein
MTEWKLPTVTDYGDLPECGNCENYKKLLSFVKEIAHHEDNNIDSCEALKLLKEIGEL